MKTEFIEHLTSLNVLFEKHFSFKIITSNFQCDHYDMEEI